MRLLLSMLLVAGCGRVDFDSLPADPRAGDAGAPDAPIAAQPLRVGERSGADLTAVTADTSLIDDDFSINCGGCDFVNSGPGEAGLLRFDLSAIDVSVLSGTVEVFLTSLPTVNDGLVEVYAMREAWDEGANTSDNPGFANWEFRQPGVSWSELGAVGASRADAPLATFTVVDAEAPIRIELPAALIQSWIDEPDQNFGVGFFGRDYTGGGGDHPHLRSSESDDPEQRPLLDLLVY